MPISSAITVDILNTVKNTELFELSVTTRTVPTVNTEDHIIWDLK